MTNRSVNHLRLQQWMKQESFRGKNAENVTKELLGLHSTDYWTPYLSLWARIGDYDASKVFESINSGKTFARVNAFRRTLHVVHVDDLPMIIRATRTVFYKSSRKVPPLRNITDKQLEGVFSKIINMLEEKPLGIAELKKGIPELKKLGRWVLLLLMAEGKVIRAHATHARSNRTAYALTEQWIEGYRPSEMSEEEALREIVSRYIASYGPVTEEDITWWLMLTKTKARQIIDNLESKIESIEFDGDTHFINSKKLDESGIEENDTPIVWFLPYEDCFAKAYIERSWYLDDELKRRIYPESAQYYWPPDNPMIPPDKHTGMSQAGEIRPSIWLNGKIIGRWEIEKEKNEYKIIFDVYRKLTKQQNELIEQKRNDLELFVNNRLGPIS